MSRNVPRAGASEFIVSHELEVKKLAKLSGLLAMVFHVCMPARVSSGGKAGQARREHHARECFTREIFSIRETLRLCAMH